MFLLFSNILKRSRTPDSLITSMHDQDDDGWENTQTNGSDG